MDTAQRLISRINGRTAGVAVVGAGYVGLPAAVEAARAGFPVTALDVSAQRVAQLAAGRSYIPDVPDQELGPLVAGGQLRATTDFGALAGADVVLICVPTPLTPHRVPDLSHVEAAGREAAARLRPGQLISLESTTYPGTTEELLLPILAAGGGQVGRDFFLVYCPERIDPGNRTFRPGQLARVLGGATAACRAVGEAFYAPLSAGLVRVSSARAAEMSKLYENIYRAVNIAMVNELAMLCDRMGLDVWEVVAAAASKPFGLQPFYPGPGVGGHCIPLDPHYLAWKAREYDFTLRFVELAGEINAGMPYFVIGKLARLLNAHGRPLRGARVLLLGVAYKRDVNDVRESPALRMMELLREAGSEVLYHDPLVPVLEPETPGGPALRSVPLGPDLPSGLDAAVVMTDHSGVDYQAVLDRVPLVLDCRGVTAGLRADPDRVWRL